MIYRLNRNDFDFNSLKFQIRHVLKQCHLNSDEVAGIGFDATCSLVVLDDHGMY